MGANWMAFPSNREKYATEPHLWRESNLKSSQICDKRTYDWNQGVKICQNRRPFFLFHRTSPRPNFSRAESANRHWRAVKRSLKRSENSLFGHLIHLDAYLSPGLRFRIRIWDPGPLQWFHSIKQTHFFLLQNHGYRRTPRMFEVFDLYTDQFHWVIVVFGGSEVTLFDLVELNRNSRWSKFQVFFWENSCLSLHFHKKKAEQHWNVRFSILVGTNTE